ncbi:hypothetical protein JHK82_016536 [Glycine max]|nr:hypothetical protein JHK82_016536 [Glycine max]
MDKLRIVSCKLDSDLESSKKQHTQLVDQCEELKQGREEFMIVAIIHCLTCYMECPMALLVCAFVVVLTILINDIPCVVEIVTDRKLVKDKPTRNSGSKYGEMLRLRHNSHTDTKSHQQAYTNRNQHYQHHQNQEPALASRLPSPSKPNTKARITNTIKTKNEHKNKQHFTSFTNTIKTKQELPIAIKP